MQRPFDLVERSYEYSKSTVLFIKRYDFKRNYCPVMNQLLKSSTSIGANIVEARSGNSRKTMINYYSVALRSANETKYWLRLVRDAFEVDRKEIDLLIAEADELSKILAKSILTLKQNDNMEKLTANCTRTSRQF